MQQNRPSRPLWLALLPVVPPIGLLSLAQLGHFARLPLPWRWLLGGFVVLQVVAALLTPDPPLSLGLALARAAYTVALVVAGFALGQVAPLRLALIGYSVVALTAFGTTLLTYHAHPLSERLIHPYYTSVSLGLAGALGLLLAVTWRGGPLVWRVLSGLLSLSMFLWSGSRGPLIALVAGLIAALLVNLRGQWRAALLALTAAAALIFGLQSAAGTTVTTRFLENTLNGRGTYWADALDTARAHPWGGAGPYQLGPHLSTQYSDRSCQLWLKAEGERIAAQSTQSTQASEPAPPCPPLLNEIRGMWLIAHNTAFHLLGETGVVGTSGWLILMGALALAAWRSRDPLLNAVTWATAAMGLVDNPTLLPNLGHAELYWLAGGVGVALSTPANTEAPSAPNAFLAPLAPLLACALLAYWTLPLWLEQVRPSERATLPTLHALVVPSTLKAGERVNLFMLVTTPAEQHFSLTGQVCRQGNRQDTAPNCQPVFAQTLTAEQQGWRTLGLGGLSAGTYSLTLTLKDQTPSLRVERPLAELTRVLHVE